MQSPQARVEFVPVQSFVDGSSLKNSKGPRSGKQQKKRKNKREAEAKKRKKKREAEAQAEAQAEAAEATNQWQQAFDPKYSCFFYCRPSTQVICTPGIPSQTLGFNQAQC